MEHDELVSGMKKRVFKERGTLCVWIESSAESLLFSGQDLAGAHGADEYEFWITVDAQDFPRILEALDAAPVDDVAEALFSHREEIFGVGELTWLKSIGVEPKFDAYF